MERCIDLLGRLWELLARRIDSYLMAAALAIAGIGMITLFSAVGPERAARDEPGAVSLAFALVLMWIVANIPPQQLARVAVPLYVVGVLLLVGVALVRHGGQRLAALAQPRRRALPAVGADEDRAAADARVVFPETRDGRVGCDDFVVARC